MSNQTRDEATRAAFYGSESFAKYVKSNGAPRSKAAWTAMLVLGTPDDRGGLEGAELEACLNQVTFFTHPSQINVFDRGSGKIVASIQR